MSQTWLPTLRTISGNTADIFQALKDLQFAPDQVADIQRRALNLETVLEVHGVRLSELMDELKKGEGCKEAADKSAGKQPRRDDDPEDQPPRKHSKTQQPPPQQYQSQRMHGKTHPSVYQRRDYQKGRYDRTAGLTPTADLRRMVESTIQPKRMADIPLQNQSLEELTERIEEDILQSTWRDVQDWILKYPQVGRLTIYGERLSRTVELFKLEWEANFIQSEVGTDLDKGWRKYLKSIRDQKIAAQDLERERELRKNLREMETQSIDVSVKVPLDQLYRPGLLPGSIVKTNDAGDLLKTFNLTAEEYSDHIKVIMQKHKVGMMQAHKWFFERINAMVMLEMQRGKTQQEATMLAKTHKATLRM